MLRSFWFTEPMDTSVDNGETGSITTASATEKETSETPMEEDSARPEGVVRFVVKDFSKLKETVLSEPVLIRNLPW